MGQAAAVVINDGTATPVAVTFAPEKVTPSDTVLVDRRKTARTLQPSIRVSFSPASAKRKTHRMTIGLDYPWEGVIDGVAAPVGVARVDCNVTVPDGLPLQDRKHVHAFIANALDNALLKGVVVDLDPLY